jgi:hypothetical protein
MPRPLGSIGLLSHWKSRFWVGPQNAIVIKNCRSGLSLPNFDKGSRTFFLLHKRTVWQAFTFLSFVIQASRHALAAIPKGTVGTTAIPISWHQAMGLGLGTTSPPYGLSSYSLSCRISGLIILFELFSLVKFDAWDALLG